MPWTPLLKGTLADEAARAARDIVLAVASQPARDATSADRTVFWAYASHVFDEPFATTCYDTAWRGDSESYQPIQNVLEGAMGVALSLLAAIGPDEPCWDRLLLCDLGGS